MIKTSECLNNAVLGVGRVSKGVVKSLVVVDKNLKKIMMLDLLIKAGTLTAEVIKKGDFDEIEDIKSIETSGDDIFILSSFKLHILDISLNQVAGVIFEMPVKDICCVS